MAAALEIPGMTTAAQLRARGVPPGRIVGAGYVRAARGVYLPADVSPDAASRVLVVAARMPSAAVIGGWAAAMVHELTARHASDDLTVFDGRMPEMDAAARRTLPVLVCGPRPFRLRPAPGVRLFRSDLDECEVEEVCGVPVTSAVRTAFDLSRLWPTTPGVVALDRLANLGLVDLEGLAELVRSRSGWLGVARARRAISLADPGAESPRESMMRLLWIAAGLPRPACNPDVLTPHGAFLGRVDLLDDEVGLVGEYDGAEHASSRRRHRDAVRQEGLEGAGLVVIRANEPDIATHPGRRSWQVRLRAAYGRARTMHRARGWRSVVRA